MIVLLRANCFKMDQLPNFGVLATSMTNAADKMRKMQNLPVLDIGAQLLQMQEQMRRMEARVGERLDRMEQNILGHLSRSYVDLCHFLRGPN
jgi:hypothetical protein